MGDDAIIRIFVKLDNIADRMARVETKIDEHNKYANGLENDISKVKESLTEHGRRFGKLNQTKAGATSVKEFIAWGVAIAATIWGWMKP